MLVGFSTRDAELARDGHAAAEAAEAAEAAAEAVEAAEAAELAGSHRWPHDTSTE